MADRMDAICSRYLNAKIFSFLTFLIANFKYLIMIFILFLLTFGRCTKVGSREISLVLEGNSDGKK